MIGSVVAREQVAGRLGQSESLALADLPALFHRLNNQLGVILANAELLEARLGAESERARAAQVVAGALEAIGSVQHLRRLLGVGADRQADGVRNPSAE
jgi:hypothetical protein